MRFLIAGLDVLEEWPPRLPLMQLVAGGVLESGFAACWRGGSGSRTPPR
ncbi:hypothetical protein QJS66_07685 [Kocuria rhizophila]|nr:hypothetical protein QJS66_07685 [Kocuria rhizophila]